MDFDWGDGRYETTAAQLEPALERVLQVAGVRPGERVLDVGCGTGNAALAAARRGASVTAVDPSERLLAAARARAAEAGLAVAFVAGEGASLPVKDSSFDAVIAVFSVIFAPDAQACVREMLRAVRAGGRIVVTSWRLEGAIHEASELLRDGQVAPPDPWSDPAGLRRLFAPHGIEPEVHDEALPFEAPSAEAWFDDVEANHPVWRAVRAARGDAWPSIRRRSLEVLTRHNEDPSAFRVTSRFLVTRADRPLG